MCLDGASRSSGDARSLSLRGPRSCGLRVCLVSRVVGSPFDAAPWLAYFHFLVSELSSHYANLGWAVSERHMDLPALLAKTEARLRDAHSVDDAHAAFRSFTTAFGDAHLRISWASPHVSSTPATGSLCKRLGYGGEEANPGVDFARTGAWTPIDDADSADFTGGILRLPSGVKLGTIRIALFMEELHPAMCEAARQELGLADDAVCDDVCSEKLAGAVDGRMTASLQRRAASLAKAGARAIVVDITANGGGLGWDEQAARALTKVPLRAERFGFVRHEHWAKQFRETLEHIAADEKDHASSTDTPLLASAEATYRAALADATSPCDLSGLWDASKPKPTCSQLVTNRLFTSGVFAYRKPGSFSGWASGDALFSSPPYAFHEGASNLPLIVLVDDHTASAAEQFAVLLTDNHAGTVAGTLTLGCGCGFTNGGIKTILPNSGGEAHLPDCARLRADGTNEASGVVPDVLFPFASRDTPYQRAVKTRDGLALVAKRMNLR